MKFGLVVVQSHTYWHPDFRVEKAWRTPDDYRAFVRFELDRSKVVLERRLDRSVDKLAWPYGIVDPELESAAKHAGYIYALAYAGGAAHPGVGLYTFPHIPLPQWARGTAFATLLGELPKTRPGS